MKARRLKTITGLALAAVAYVLGVALPSSANADSCTNAALRVGTPSAGLSDCRAYEMVSPLDKGPASDVVEFFGFGSVPSVDGDRISYITGLPLPNAVSAPVISQNLATRGQVSWSSVSIAPPVPDVLLTGLEGLQSNLCVAFTPDVSRCVFSSRLSLAAGAIVSPTFMNFYLDNLTEHAYTLLTPFNDEPAEGSYVGLSVHAMVTGDARHVAFQGAGAFTGDTVGKSLSNPSVFEWNAATPGALSNVGVLPASLGGKPIVGEVSLGGPATKGAGSKRNAMSADGSRVFFTAYGQLWMRENGTSTTWISASQRTSPEGLGEAGFAGATTDGSKVFFASRSKLTNDSTASSEARSFSFASYVVGDLYEYDLTSGLLTDLTVDHSQGDPRGAEVQGLLEYSNDGQYVYFVALGQLVAEQGTAGQPNLYLWHNGQITYLTTLDGQIDPGHGTMNDSKTWEENTSVFARSAVSANGHQLAFVSDARLTADDNAGHTEVYFYDADSGRLVCVSCNPNGLPSTSDASFGSVNVYRSATGQPTNLSADGGRLFFDTGDSLLPAQDTNGQEDVYEWERQGAGNCTRPAGCVYLLSSGKGGSESIFQGASANGNDAFFITRDQLVGQDTDTRVDLYDARVEGGFPSPAPAPSPCSDEGCRPALSPPPALAAAGTIAFDGPGNLAAPVVERASKPKAKKFRRKKRRRGKAGKVGRAIRKHGRNGR